MSSIVSSESLRKVETLLREHLFRGFCLLEKPCPACTTPLVVSATDNEEKEEDSSSWPILGIAYCVNCDAHVISRASEIERIDRHHDNRNKGTIFVSVSSDQGPTESTTLQEGDTLTEYTGTSSLLRRRRAQDPPASDGHPQISIDPSVEKAEDDQAKTSPTVQKSNMFTQKFPHLHHRKKSSQQQEESQPSLWEMQQAQVERVVASYQRYFEDSTNVSDALSNGFASASNSILVREDEVGSSHRGGKQSAFAGRQDHNYTSGVEAETNTITPRLASGSIASSLDGAARDGQTVDRERDVGSVSTPINVDAGEKSVSYRSPPEELQSTMSGGAGDELQTTLSHESIVDLAIQRTESMAVRTAMSNNDFPLPPYDVRREIAVEVLSNMLVDGYLMRDEQCGYCSMPLVGKTDTTIEPCCVCKELKGRHDESIRREAQRLKLAEMAKLAASQTKEPSQDGAQNNIESSLDDNQILSEYGKDTIDVQVGDSSINDQVNKKHLGIEKSGVSQAMFIVGRSVITDGSVASSTDKTPIVPGTDVLPLEEPASVLGVLNRSEATNPSAASESNPVQTPTQDEIKKECLREELSSILRKSSTSDSDATSQHLEGASAKERKTDDMKNASQKTEETVRAQSEKRKVFAGISGGDNEKSSNRLDATSGHQQQGQNLQSTFEEKRTLVRREITARMRTGWMLLDLTCSKCVMPMMADPYKTKQLCVLCGEEGPYVQSRSRDQRRSVSAPRRISSHHEHEVANDRSLRKNHLSPPLSSRKQYLSSFDSLHKRSGAQSVGAGARSMSVPRNRPSGVPLVHHELAKESTTTNPPKQEQLPYVDQREAKPALAGRSIFIERKHTRPRQRGEHFPYTSNRGRSTGPERNFVESVGTETLPHQPKLNRESNSRSPAAWISSHDGEIKRCGTADDILESRLSERNLDTAHFQQHQRHYQSKRPASAPRDDAWRADMLSDASSVSERVSNHGRIFKRQHGNGGPPKEKRNLVQISERRDSIGGIRQRDQPFLIHRSMSEPRQRNTASPVAAIPRNFSSSGKKHSKQRHELSIESRSVNTKLEPGAAKRYRGRGGGSLRVERSDPAGERGTEEIIRLDGIHPSVLPWLPSPRKRDSNDPPERLGGFTKSQYRRPLSPGGRRSLPENHIMIEDDENGENERERRDAPEVIVVEDIENYTRDRSMTSGGGSSRTSRGRLSFTDPYAAGEIKLPSPKGTPRRAASPGLSIVSAPHIRYSGSSFVQAGSPSKASRPSSSMGTSADRYRQRAQQRAPSPGISLAILPSTASSIYTKSTERRTSRPYNPRIAPEQSNWESNTGRKHHKPYDRRKQFSRSSSFRPINSSRVSAGSESDVIDVEPLRKWHVGSSNIIVVDDGLKPNVRNDGDDNLDALLTRIEKTKSQLEVSSLNSKGNDSNFRELVDNLARTAKQMRDIELS